MRGAEVEARTGGVLDFLELVELRSVVSGDSTNEEHLTLNELYEPPIEFGGASSTKLADDGVSGFPLYERHDAVPVVGADDGVDFPVPEPGTIISAARSL